MYKYFKQSNYECNDKVCIRGAMPLVGSISVKPARNKIQDLVYDVDDYDKSFDIPKKLLRWTSIWIFQNGSRISGNRNFFFWFELVNLLMLAPSEFFGMVTTVAKVESWEDFNKVFKMIPCFGAVALSLFKCCSMSNHRFVYKNLVRELRTMCPKGLISKKEHKVIRKSLKQLNFIVKGYFWCNHVLLGSYMVPTIVICFARLAGYDYPKILHFTYWVPFDIYKPGVFEIMLFMQTWHAILVIWLNVAWDMLFCIFLCHITIQFELLAFKIKKLFFVNDQDSDKTDALVNFKEVNKMTDLFEGYAEYDSDTKQQRELTEIVLKHHALIRLSKDVESICSLTLLINFVNGSVIICFCGFCCVLVEKWSDVAYKSFLLTTLSQTWLLWWYGQKLKDSSLAISEALYNCGWYNTSKKFKTFILIMLHRAQQSVHVTTFGFSVVSLASFSTIVKTSWSYFTLLLNFYEK